MIVHAAEVWITLFAAFVIGSVLGWLIYRLVDRSDYAFDQRELSDAVSRRLWGRDALDFDEDDLPPPGQLRLPPPPRSRAAEKLRSKVRSSARAAAWTEARDPDAPDAVGESRSEQPSPVAGKVRSERPDRSPHREEARKGVTPQRRQPAQSPPKASPRRSEPLADDQDHGDPWPSPLETWPIRKPVWPSVKGPPQLPGAGKSAALPVLSQGPAHDEIWPAAPDLPKKERIVRRATPADIEDAWPEPIEITMRPAETPAKPAETPARTGRVFGKTAVDPSVPARTADPDVEEAATMLSTEEVTDKDRPPALSARPANPDNLKRIKGIGPAFHKKLNKIGIYQFRQIASWTPAERDWVSQTLGAAARIEKDDWIGQAVELSEPGTGR